MNMGIVAGLIKALAPGVDPQVIEQAVTDWLDEHPEATTTVEDGSITEEKLAQDVLAELGEIEELKDAIGSEEIQIFNSTGMLEKRGFTIPKKTTLALIFPVDLEQGVAVTFSMKLNTALDKNAWIYLKDSSGNNLISGGEKTLSAGNTTLSFDFTPAADYKNATFKMTTNSTGNTDASFEYAKVVLKGVSIKSIPDVEEEVTAVSGRVGTLEQYFNASDRVFSSGTTANYYYKMVNSVPTQTAYSGASCQKIEIGSWVGDKVSFTIGTLISSVDATYCVFTDENDDFISRETRTTGAQVLTIPLNAKYIYLSFYPSPYGTTFSIAASTLVTSEDMKKAGLSNNYKGKSGVAFGTSLTYRSQTSGGYLQYLPSLSGIEFDNQGIGSSFIYYSSGDQNMLEAIKAYDDYSDKDVVIVEGFVNDWYWARTLGTWKDNTETSVCGCVRSALNYIRTQNANATVFLVLDHYGREVTGVDMSASAVNSAGLMQFEFYEEVAKVAESTGVKVIKLYEVSGINEYAPQYFIDEIHLNNTIGAELEANAIWSEMRRYYPNIQSQS